MLNNIIDRIRLPFRKEKELYLSLYKILGFFPNNIQYYKQALMHKSIMRREKGKPVNNERLEFLGDAILGAVVGHIVYIHFDGKREGFLTNTRSKIVQRETLNKLARELGITDLILSSGHSSSHNSYLGGNAFEALVGAVYLDKGFKGSFRFIRRLMEQGHIDIARTARVEENFKSVLLEWGQKHKLNVKFVLISEDDSSKGKRFNYAVMVEGREVATATGFSKKESHQLAAKKAIKALRRNPNFERSLRQMNFTRRVAEDLMHSTV